MDVKDDYLGFLLKKPPFSKKAVDRLGKFYAGKQTEAPQQRQQILSWYSTLGEKTLFTLQDLLVNQFPYCQLLTANTRVKTEKTASEKILHTNVQLSKMFDFVGVRLEWDCFLGDLIEMAYSIEEFLGAEDVEVLIRDYREDAQHGYRAVHTIIRSPAGIVEVQLRTLLQARWANAYEMLADVMGRKIRYQEIELSEDEPLGVVYSNLQRISTDIAEIEKAIESRSENTNTALMNLVNSRHFLPLSVETQVLRANTLASLVQAETYATLSALQNARLVKHLEELAEILQEMKKMASPQPKVR